MKSQSELMRSLLNVLTENINETVKKTSRVPFAPDYDARDRALSDYDGLETIVKTPGAIIDYDPFTKTVKGYKLYKTRNGKLYPLFVDGNTPVPVGQWQNSIDPYSFVGSGFSIHKTTKILRVSEPQKYVPAKTGDARFILDAKTLGEIKNLPDRRDYKFGRRRCFVTEAFARQYAAVIDLLPDAPEAIPGMVYVAIPTVKAVAYRPGWHAGDLPMATHIGPVSGDEFDNKLRGDDEVWAEVELPADVEHQAIAYANARKMKDGGHEASSAHITDFIPFGGHYRYKTNPNMTGNWLISGNCKVIRVLSREEAKKINADNGMADLPTRVEYDDGERHPVHKDYDPANPKHLHYKKD